MDELLTPTETAARLKVAVNTLRDWRRLGKGPPFFKKGNLVRYKTSDVESWIQGGVYPAGGEQGT